MKKKKILERSATARRHLKNLGVGHDLDKILQYDDIDIEYYLDDGRHCFYCELSKKNKSFVARSCKFCKLSRKRCHTCAMFKPAKN